MALRKLALPITVCRGASVGSWTDNQPFMQVTSSCRPIYQFSASVDLPTDTTIRAMKLIFDISNSPGATNVAEVCRFSSFSIIGANNSQATTAYNSIGSATSFASGSWSYVGPTGRVTVEIDIPNTQWSSIMTNLRLNGRVGFGFRLPSMPPSSGIGLATEVTAMGGTISKATNEAAGPPVFLIEYDPPRNAALSLQMRYTSNSPSLSQNTPQNSLGGFYASNSVYDNFVLSRGVARSDTVVLMDTLPTPDSGLLSMGPEVVRYGSKTVDSVILSARNIAHNGAVPVCLRSYGDMESVYLLSLSKLFNTSILSGPQYRCLAFVHAGPSLLPIQNIQITLAQAQSSKSQLEYGIEIPAWNSISGTQLNSPPYAGSPNTVHDSTLAGHSDGHYDGGYIYFNSPMNEWARITTYTTDGTFVLSANVSYGSIPGNQTFFVAPAPSQTVPNERSVPFAGSFVAPNVAVNAMLLGSDDGIMRQNDCFYVWLKRTLISNTAGEEDLAAVLTIRYRHTNLLITGRVLTSGGAPKVDWGITGNSTTVYTDHNGVYVLPVPVGFTGSVINTDGTPPSRSYRNLLNTMSAQDFINDTSPHGEG